MAMVDRSRSRSPRLTYVSSLQPSNDHRPRFLWLVKQVPPWDGYWREATHFGPHLEEQYLKEVETAEGDLVFPDQAVNYYTHKMIKGDPVMTQTRFKDKDRTEIMYEKEIVRAFMQRSREQRLGPTRPSNNMQD